MLSVPPQNNKNNKNCTETFLTTKQASAIVPYSREYIGRLARENKVDAKFVDGKWLVNEHALKNFFDQSKIEESILSDRLRNERYADLLAYECVRQEQATEATFLSSAHLRTHLITASTIAVSLFALVFLSSATLTKMVTQEALLPLYEGANQSNQVVVYESVERTTPFAMSHGIMLFPETATASTFDPATLFSDEVAVVEGVDGLQYIRFRGENGTADFPFVVVPPSSHDYE